MFLKGCLKTSAKRFNSRVQRSRRPGWSGLMEESIWPRTSSRTSE